MSQARAGEGQRARDLRTLTDRWESLAQLVYISASPW